jgi:MinD-like ATPase involved in chromosome partitioning or flagellar assembly
MKKVFFITQSKGGAGKSVLTFMLAEKYKTAKLFDLDDATTTTMRQLAYRNPLMISFIDPVTKRIDRSTFDELFEKIHESKSEMFIADLGASVAEVLPVYFESNDAELISRNLKSFDIEVTLLCVIAGGNNFIATLDYLAELKTSVGENIQIKAAINNHHPLSDSQRETINLFCQKHHIEHMDYDIVKEKGESALRTIADTLQNGLGIDPISPFKKIYFERAIDQLAI